jgi:SAM-dependent methyltransferase
MNSAYEYKGEDAKYHYRHQERTLQRAEKIAAFITAGSRVLDVGCNNGITSNYILRNTEAASVVGVELSAATVDQDVRNDDRFDFIEGNICDLKIEGVFDSIVYGAVHHHILREKGLGESIKVFRNLISHCRSQLFFETGHITEGGRWEWQRAIRRHFHTDEEHLHYLMRSVEDRIAEIKIIGKFRIHGVRRWLIRIKLNDRKDGVAELFDQLPLDVVSLDLIPSRRMFRTFGSNKQQIYYGLDISRESPNWFYIVDTGKKRLFVKQAVHSPFALLKEARVVLQSAGSFGVPPVGRTDEVALVYPYVEGKTLFDYVAVNPRSRSEIARQIINIWEKCSTETINVSYGLLLPLANNAKLSNVIDLNQNNFLIEECSDGVFVVLVDFEPQSNHYGWRNRMHIARILFKLRYGCIRASLLWIIGVLLGVWYLFKYQFISIEKRIIDRQPSLGSVLLANIRTITGRALIRIAQSLKEL